MSIADIDQQIAELERQKQDLQKQERQKVVRQSAINTNAIWLALIQESEKFNGFDGELVAEKLIYAQELWLSIAFYPSAYVTGERQYWSDFGIDLSPMISVGQYGRWDCDVLWIFSAPGKEDELKIYVEENLQADEVDYVRGDYQLDRDSNKYRSQILRVWWD